MAENEGPGYVTETLAKLLQEANSKSAAATGVCLITIPGNPTPRCVQLTAQQCADVKGVFVGGNCP